MTDCRKYYIPRIDRYTNDVDIFEIFLQPSAVGKWLIHVDDHPIPPEIERMCRFEEGVHCFATKAAAVKKLRNLRDAKVRRLKREIEALQAMKFEEAPITDHPPRKRRRLEGQVCGS